MKTIGELLTRELNRKIPEIIQVDDSDVDSVYSEITEYVPTESITKQYIELFEAIAEAPSHPPDGIGVWVSGFFGSGKSSFAKNLGYALQNRNLLGQNFAELFKEQFVGQRLGPRLSALLDSITARFPTEVILFEIAKERDTRMVTERIAEFMYTVLLRELDYAEDFDIAELEIELESENRLPQFVEECRALHNRDWKILRKGAQRLSRASAILHALDPATYPSADSWSHAQRNRDASMTVSKVVARTFELMQRRRPGKALVFVIDEVGQHVARSSDRIEDLRATIEEFGKVGRGLLKARKIIAPCWVVVTSQEKLDEVVAAIDSKRVDIAKLQDRFGNRVDLAPSDIREVATKRVLAKRHDALPELKKLFSENQGILNAALRLERTSRQTAVTEDDFLQFYPYPPHYVDLCIGIVSGIRLQPGAPRHYGGSNRTIIKQAYEMLVSDRTAMAGRPVGALVTLDKVYELVDGNLSNEKRTDIHEIAQRFRQDPQEQFWCLRVAKVICLLEFLRDLPRTEANLAAFLVDEVGKPSPVKEVEGALKRLHAAQFIRSTEEGWKLQTAQEKSWETERAEHLEPKPRERNEIVRHILRAIFAETSLKTFRYKELRTFRIGATADGAEIGEAGDIAISLQAADDVADFQSKLGEVRDESRQDPHKNDIYWVWSQTTDIYDLTGQVYASRRMVEKYSQLKAQQKITTEEGKCFQDEQNSEMNYQARLRDSVVESLESGVGMFRGVAKDAPSLGKTLSEIVKKLLTQVIPDLYPKLEMGSRRLGKGDEAELVLKAADLRALPPVFLPGDDGLGLVAQDGPKYVINTSADIAREVFNYLKSEHSYGSKDSRTGKALERRFTGTPFGWERDMLRLVLAVLFRAGEIEVTYQGNRFHNYQDPLSRTPFTNNVAFRSSLFSPRQSVGLKALTQAVQQLEDLTGEEVDVEEGAIATAFKRVASEELERVYPLKALAEAHQLPVSALLAEYQLTLQGIQSSASDDCVRILTDTGAMFQETRDRVRKIRESLNDPALGLLRQARVVVDQVWPKLSLRVDDPKLGECTERLRGLLSSEQFIDSLGAIATDTRVVLDAYNASYAGLYRRRADAYAKAIEEIKNRPEWERLETANSEMAQTLIAPLKARLGTDALADTVALGDVLGAASLTEMESDLAAVDGLRSSVLVKLQELTIGGERKAPVRRVRVAEFFSRPIQTQRDLDDVLEQLRDSLQKFIDEGAAIILE